VARSTSSNSLAGRAKQSVWTVAKHTTGIDLPIRLTRLAAQDAMTPWRTLVPPQETPPTVETFAQLGLSEAEMAAIRRHCRWAFGVVSPVSGLCVILWVWLITLGDGLGALGAGGGVLIGGSLCLRYSLVSLQVRQRQLMSFRAWARQPQEWWPR